MILGNGLISKAFKEFSHKFDDDIIFGSGVSNSSIRDTNQFEREISLLRSHKTSNKKLIYFSTSSIFDKQSKESLYVQHKINIENYIQKNFNRYLIYRLPIVVGRSANPNTLTNYLYRKINTGEKITIHKNASRYLIDIDDVVKYVCETKNAANLAINLHLNNKLSIIDIVAIFERVLAKRASCDFENTGDSYTIDDSLFLNLIGRNQSLPIDSEAYVFNLIKKYYGLNENNFGNL